MYRWIIGAMLFVVLVGEAVCFYKALSKINTNFTYVNADIENVKSYVVGVEAKNKREHESITRRIGKLESNPKSQGCGGHGLYKGQSEAAPVMNTMEIKINRKECK